MSMPRGFQMIDAALVVTAELPATAESIVSDPIQTMNSDNGSFQSSVEFLLEAPALTAGELTTAETMTYELITSDSEDMSGPTTLSELLVQTGDSVAGAAADEVLFGLPRDVQQYVAIKVTNSDTGDASGKSLTLTPKF